MHVATSIFHTNELSLVSVFSFFSFCENFVFGKQKAIPWDSDLYS